MFGIRVKSRESKAEGSLYVETGSSLVVGWGWGTGSDSSWVRGSLLGSEMFGTRGGGICSTLNGLKVAVLVPVVNRYVYFQ